MTKEQAIKILHPDTMIEALAEIEYYAGFGGHTAVIKAVEDAHKIACDALEKQICKKVIIQKYSPARCPSCGMELSESLGDGYYKHYTHLVRCPNAECGQKLRWR